MGLRVGCGRATCLPFSCLPKVSCKPRRTGPSSHAGEESRVGPRTMPMKPLVSILIPAYNAEEWIGDTLKSAIGQTWERKEITIVDDWSSGILENMSERMRQ